MVGNNMEAPHKTHSRKVIRSVCIVHGYRAEWRKSSRPKSCGHARVCYSIILVAEVWNQCPPMNGWMQKMWHVSTMEIWRKSAILPSAVGWTDRVKWNKQATHRTTNTLWSWLEHSTEIPGVWGRSIRGGWIRLLHAMCVCWTITLNSVNRYHSTGKWKIKCFKHINIFLCKPVFEVRIKTAVLWPVLSNHYINPMTLKGTIKLQIYFSPCTWGS